MERTHCRLWVVCLVLVVGGTSMVEGSFVTQNGLRRSFFLRTEVIDPTPHQCVRNSTHCTCRERSVQQLRLQQGLSDTGSRLCAIDEFEKEEMECSCPGDSLCEIKQFECTKLRKLGPVSETTPKVVDCNPEKGTCFKASAVDVCSSHSNIWIDGVFSTCVRNMPVQSDVDDAYGLVNNRANNLENAMHDYINFRMVETLANKEVHLCVLFGNWRIGQLEHAQDLRLRKEKTRITASFPLGIEIMDDPDDQVTGDGSNDLIFSHSHFANESDGFCVGPILHDGSGFRSVFFDISMLLGVNFQTSTPSLGLETGELWDFESNREPNLLTDGGRANGDDSVTIDVQPACNC